jgi:hypothetical protein
VCKNRNKRCFRLTTFRFSHPPLKRGAREPGARPPVDRGHDEPRGERF